VLAEDDGARELAIGRRIGQLDRRGVHPGADVDEAGGAQAALRRRPVREVVLAPEAGEPRGEPRIRGDLLDPPEHARDVRPAAALGDQAASGRERAVDAREEGGMVAHPVERRGAEDEVGRPLERELEQVGFDEAHPARVAGEERPPRLREHARRAVDGEHAAGRQAVEQLGGEAAGAAAGVDRRLAAPERRLLVDRAQHLPAPADLRVGHPVVGRRVPLRGRSAAPAGGAHPGIGPTYSTLGRISRLFASCSSMCAVQPAVRAAANVGV
jgi:hypothetical protein